MWIVTAQCVCLCILLSRPEVACVARFFSPRGIAVEIEYRVARVVCVACRVRVGMRRVLGLRARRAGSALWEGRVACVVAPVPPGLFFVECVKHTVCGRCFMVMGA